MNLLWWPALLMAAYAPLEGVAWQCSIGSGRGRVDIIVGAGAMHESEGARGVAHLLEHLIFRKGNFTYRHENGQTTLDYTSFYRTSNGPAIGEAAESLLRELIAPSLNERDFEVERRVVIKELEERGLDRSTGNDPLFGGTLLARSPGGTASDVRSLRLQDVRQFHERFYGKANVAVRITNASDCAVVENRLRPLLASWPTKSAAAVPRVPQKEPRSVALPGPQFRQGFYWYQADPEEALLWVAVGEHLQLSAFRELRQERGLIYTPGLEVVRVGPGGLLALTLNAGDNGREVGQWFEDTVAALKTEPRVTAHLSEALGRVRQWLDEHPEAEALAAIRGQPDPRTLLDRLRTNVPQERLQTMLVDRRRFGTKLAQSNIATLLILVGFAGVVLFVVFRAGKQFLNG